MIAVFPIFGLFPSMTTTSENKRCPFIPEPQQRSDSPLRAAAFASESLYWQTPYGEDSPRRATGRFNCP
jgi:hypothetical protein